MKRYLFIEKILLMIFLAFISFLISVKQGISADITRSNELKCNIELNGTINNGDEIAFAGIFAEGNAYEEFLCLDSPGGSIAAALKIADIITGSGITTYIRKDGSCLSACAIIFMAGSDLEEFLQPRRKMHFSANLGFHAPYLTVVDGEYNKNDIDKAFASAIDVIYAMLSVGAGERQDGFIPPRIVRELLKKGPADFYMVDNALKARELSIDIDGLSEPVWNNESMCSACKLWNEGQYSSDACPRPIRVRRVTNAIFEFTFDGFAAEAVGQCIVRLTKNETGEILASIYPATYEGDQLDEDGFRDLSAVDALPERYRFGN